jgi:hypothetical protein
LLPKNIRIARESVVTAVASSVVFSPSCCHLSIGCGDVSLLLVRNLNIV